MCPKPLRISSGWNICKYLNMFFLLLSLCARAPVSQVVGQVRWWERVYKWGSVYVKEAVTQKHIWERWKAREGWVTTLPVPPLAVQFCPNNSRLMYQAETFHISSLRSFWQLTSCSVLFFATMAWVSHSTFSVTLPTAMLPAVQCSKSVPQPRLSHLVHFPLTLHNSNFKSHQYRVSWGNLDGGGDWCMKNIGRDTTKFLSQD